MKYSTIEGVIRQTIKQPIDNMIKRIKIEDYNGNDIVELNLNFELLTKLNLIQHSLNVVETDEYNIADHDEDDKGEFIRIQLNHPERIL